MMDRTTTIKASVADVERTLILSIVLVILVVFVFLRNGRATLIPAVAVPVSLIGTFAVMYMLGFSLDNLSLMALTISTGFVVDDAIVVMENITRHLEDGMTPMAATFRGAKEIGFTVLSISISLIAVFIPLLLMGGIVGRLFREFAITLSTAIVVSMVISLTTTPTMCAYLLKDQSQREHSRFYLLTERFFDWILSLYRRSLHWVLDNPALTLTVLALTIALNVIVIIKIPKGFFPQQDTGLLGGGIQGPQDASFPAMNDSLLKIVKVIREDPAVKHIIAFTGGGGATNTGGMFIALKPLNERPGKVGAPEIINRIRPKLNRMPVASAFLQAGQDLRIGGRSSNAQYQYTIQADNTSDLATWGPKLTAAMKRLPGFQDVNSDQQNGGLDEVLTYDRVSAARLGLTAQALDSGIYSAFGQSEVSLIYTQLNQYYVVLEFAPQFWQSPEGLNSVYFHNGSSSSNTATGNTPLAALSSSHATTVPLAINHTGLFPSVTVSFNLAPGYSLSDATLAVANMKTRPGYADQCAWILCRHGAGLSAVARVREVSRHHGHPCCLHCAGDAVRESGSSDHHHLDDPFGERRGYAGADALPSGPERHLDHRHRTSDRHREEERHHDDRLRAAGGARPGAEYGRRDLPGLHVTFPSHPDDDDGRAVWRAAPGVWHGNGGRSCGGRSGLPSSAD